MSEESEPIGKLGRRWSRNCGQKLTFIVLPSGTEEFLLHTNQGGGNSDERVDERLDRGCTQAEDAQGGVAIWQEEDL